MSWYLKNMFCMTILIYKSDSVKIYDTLLPNETFWGQSGLHYLKENQSVEFSGSLTFCVRFRYIKFTYASSLWDIKEPGSWVRFFQSKTEYPRTFMFFGNGWSEAHTSLIIKDPILEEFNVWHMNMWQHLCFAYHKTLSHVSLVKVSFLYSYIPLCQMNIHTRKVKYWKHSWHFC